MLTLLVKGSKYALLGDSKGEVIRIPVSSLPALSSVLKAPDLVPCPPLTDNRVGGYIPIVRRDIPPDVVIKFRYHICPVSLILIYYAFEEGRRIWYLRELRGNDGKGTGNYYDEGGGYEPPSIFSRG